MREAPGKMKERGAHPNARGTCEGMAVASVAVFSVGSDALVAGKARWAVLQQGEVNGELRGKIQWRKNGRGQRSPGRWRRRR
jgi:GH24 family phage-related lysozyme (muramidase)